MDNKHWNIDKTLSYNCLFNFIYGPRGSGKTYTSLWKCVNKAIKSNFDEQFLYLRRYKEELKKLTTQRGGRLFNAVSTEFPGWSFKAEANNLCIGRTPENPDEKPLWKTIGYAASLNTSLLQKSDSMPQVQWIIFDEFLIDTSGGSVYRYLPDEVEVFLNFYETVARGRDVHVLFLGNAISASNPYFDYFRISPPTNGYFKRSGDILIENVQVDQLMKERKDSRFGKLINNTEYSEYAYDNKWLLDSTEFIEKKTQRSMYVCSLKFGGEWYGIWEDPLLWRYYVSLDFNEEYPIRYAITSDDHQANTLLVKNAYKLGVLSNLLEAYQAGAMRYENQKCKVQFREIMRTIGLGR